MFVSLLEAAMNVNHLEFILLSIFLKDTS